MDGRYVVVERIAAGGMGEVYRARDTVLDREVAIKVLHRSLASDQAFVDRFRREARAAGGLSHPNIVAVYDWGSVDGIYYMVMEYVRGTAARGLLNQRGPLEPAQAVDIVRQTLLGLEHAHRQGIVHRDIKPENVLVTTEGVVKVADFGLARAYADGRQTQAGSVTGTVQYLAPEQIRGEPADPRSDLYSLGIVTYELLTGKLPFTGETAMSIAYKHLSGRVPRPSAVVASVPTDLDGFVLSASDRDRELRPESATAMRHDIEAIAPTLPDAVRLAGLVQEIPNDGGDDTDTVTTGVVSVPEHPGGDTALHTDTIPHPKRGHRWRWSLGLVALLAALAASAWGVWTYVIPHRAEVPVVAGAAVADAQTQLSEAGFAVRLADGQYSEKVPADRVLRVQPGPGTLLQEGETVVLIPSLGPAPVKVPDVSGRSPEQARQLLRKAGLTVGDRSSRHSASVPEGSVIATAQTGQVPAGSEVDLILSSGPPPLPVPEVVRLPEDEAIATLQGAGFSVNVEADFSNTIDRGSVASVTPRSGSVVAHGSSVTIVVSMGPERFPAPSFSGLSKSQAEAKAADAGLEVSFFVIPHTEGSTVISQNPGPGATVTYGDTITLFLA